MILLDTDVLIDVLRQYPPAVEWLRQLGDEVLLVPGYVVMELLQGCASRAEQEKIEKVLAGASVLWPTEAACNQALVTFARYHLSHNLGMLDALIGQLAVSVGLPLFTFNVRHYAAVPGLETVQPYPKGS